MLIFPSLGNERKLNSFSWIDKFLFISCVFIHLNQAGVIKKQDAVTGTSSGNNGLDIKETEVVPTILTAVNNNASEVVTTKLQSVGLTYFATETSRELSNNEILLNKAKKLLENDEIIASKNNTKSEAESKHETQSKTENKFEHQDEDLLNNIKIIKTNLNMENKKEILNTTEFGSNDIKKEVIQKSIAPVEIDKEVAKDDAKLLILKQPTLTTDVMPNTERQEESKHKENPSPFENNFKSHDEKPRPPSRILTELKTEIESQITQPKVETTQYKAITQNDNFIDNKNEHLQKESLYKSKVFLANETSDINLEINQDIVFNTKPALSAIQAFNYSQFTSKPEEEIVVKNLETSTIALTSVFTTISEELNNIKGSESFPKHKSTLSQDDNSNSTHDGLYREQLLKSNEVQYFHQSTTESINQIESILQPKNERELTIFDGSKMEYGRSMYMEHSKEKEITAHSRDDNELSTSTTFKPAILSITDSIAEARTDNVKEAVEGVTEESISTNIVRPFTESIKGNENLKQIMEKKPKHINDNSTNAQQLNLPNNAEAWSLAAMKSLPKANVTMETAQSHNITDAFKENTLHNNTISFSNNSEKNLLDWSQIMMDKELSTTTRNEEFKKEEGHKENHLINEDSKTAPINFDQHKQEMQEKYKDLQIIYTTTSPPEEATILSSEDMVTITPFIEQEITTTTISSTTTTTVLSNSNNDKSMQDKNIEENIKNYIETLTQFTENQATTIKIPTTNAAPTTNNTPSNTSMNNELNVNEKINLTLNQTQSTLNNDVLTTAKNQSVGVDENVNVETINAATTTTTTTTTEITAVVDMTTLQQPSSESTTVSTLETSKQNASIGNTVVQQQNKNVIFKESTHNELENLYKQTKNNNLENIELRSELIVTTIVPITTFRPSTLAVTSNTSLPLIFKQEIDRNGIDIQNKLANTEQQQSIIKTLDNNNYTQIIETHLIETKFETTTPDAITTTSAIIASKIENTLTSSLENTTSFFKDDKISETTEIKLDFGTTTTTTTTTTPTPTKSITTEATPKKVDDHNNKGDENTIGSPVTDAEFERKEKEIEKTTTETTSFITTVTPVVIESHSSTILNEGSTLTTAVTANEIKEKQSQLLELEQGNILNENDVKTTTMSTSTIITTAILDDGTTDVSLLEDTPPTPTTLTTRTTTPTEIKTSTTAPSEITTKIQEIYNIIPGATTATTTEVIQTTTTQLLTEAEESSSTDSKMIPLATTTLSTKMIGTANKDEALPTLTSIMGGNSGNMYPKNSEASGETDVNVIIAITVSVIGVIALILLVGFLYLMRKRQKQTSYSQRCRPVSLDEYTIDNISVGGSMRKSSALRSSKRTYGNLAFDDPSLRHNPMGVHELAKFVQEKLRIFEEFRDVPQITSRLDEVPPGCEDKNRFANVLPLPETRVILQRLNDDEKTEYINANYVTGPKDPMNYYIACQAPLDTTVEEFWRMIWEQQSRVIIQATDLIENGVEKCAEYLPPSVMLDNHSTYGDFQITLQNREVKDKYAISTVLLKHVGENATRELTHYWYKWPEVGVPAAEAPIIAMLLEARSSLISYAIEQANEDKQKPSMSTFKSAEEGTASANGSTELQENHSNASTSEINGNISTVNNKKTARNQGPLTIHCSPGTGRTGTIIACDIAIRSLETPQRTVDIPQIVYYVRRGRASAVLTKEQYEFIYKVANMYAAKITNPTNYN